mgnify:FL=1
MKKIDIKSAIIGALCTVIIFMFIGANNQNKNLGDIVVNSITVVDTTGVQVVNIESSEFGGVIFVNSSNDENDILMGSTGEMGGIILTSTKGMRTGFLNDGSLGLYKSGNPIAYLGTGDGDGGYLTTTNSKGFQTSYLGTGQGGIGYISTHNSEGKRTSYLGTGIQGFGFLTTHNSEGKSTSYLGTSETGQAFLSIENSHGNEVGYFGANGDKDGIIFMNDRYGNRVWGETGKK